MSQDTIVLIVAVIATVIGIGSFIHLFLIVNGWPRATGRVVGNEAELRSGDSRNDYAFFPRIAFEAADGVSYEIKGDIGKSREWPVGQPVPLRYRLANPNHASIMNGWQRLLFSAVFAGFVIASWGAWLGIWS